MLGVGDEDVLVERGGILTKTSSESNALSVQGAIPSVRTICSLIACTLFTASIRRRADYLECMI